MSGAVLAFDPPGPWEVWAPNTLPACIACGHVSKAAEVIHANSRVVQCGGCRAMAVVLPAPPCQVRGQ